ncbi:bifunctional adenosylcobinamide kinase/adenosylcobinamide-phosphate guanylyltransferase [Nocardioides sp. Kera G14]|uniref:bifunctional adenosylcobinamide kinase/adenosylcobinamide-phosphate guanylyltransferase n=1 Tax=Nocardioides sp. Kera G14 TaxID=2884264 RepID=UPI001D11DF0D|nr:bifunctional adenosylcobinamide kinase/adenosylcobinamide-phosphate guanylyltransferase [Nocardioides sp. Kera G14]UDY24894.1 bifunctional adenosylcobinamide kinase/adenosylcobinamide-phosphate guanylyltransferase [Nocardioides sp. Kera G14]
MKAARVLVTGGVRSGKSRHAESLLPADAPVTYVAAGPSPEDESDADWATRVREHRDARPEHWTTLETRDLAGSLSSAGPVIVDCLGTWLTALLDEDELWDAPADVATSTVLAEVSRAVAALDARSEMTVLVTNEVGLGIVPTYRSGRLFRDLLGLVNQRVAEHCDEVHLVVAGRVLVL